MLTGRTRTVVAVVLATAGVAAAAWSVYSLQRRPTVRSIDRRQPGGPGPGAQGPGGHSPDGLPPGGEHRIVNDSGDGPGIPVDPVPQGPFDFKPVQSDAEFADAGDAIEAAVAESAKSLAWLDAARADRRTAASAARVALVAPARGRAVFDAAVLELKGDPKAGDSEAATIVAMFEGAKVDLSHLLIKQGPEEQLGGGPPRPPADGAPAKARMMMRIERSGDGPDDEEATVSIPTSALFPQTADEVKDGEKTIEIKCPARLPGVEIADGRAQIGIVLVRERSSGVWQPVMYNFYSRDRAAAATRAKSVREQRDKQ